MFELETHINLSVPLNLWNRAPDIYWNWVIVQNGTRMLFRLLVRGIKRICKKIYFGLLGVIKTCELTPLYLQIIVQHKLTRGNAMCVWHNIKMQSPNHCYFGKAINTTYFYKHTRVWMHEDVGMCICISSMQHACTIS